MLRRHAIIAEREALFQRAIIIIVATLQRLHALLERQ